MIIITEKVSNEKIEKLNKLSEFYDPKEIIMFDIETTGLSAASSYIYMIGINYLKDGNWYITQLFNEDGKSEAEIIERFMHIINPYEYLIHFNGDNFDIPFVTKRLSKLNLYYHQNISNNFTSISSVDLYKLIKPYKNTLNLENVKQKTIETYLGINRIDKYNGGELINIYFEYLNTKDREYEKLLLQHNRDDMEGMYFLSSIFCINALDEGKFNIEGINCTTDTSNLLWLNIQISLKHLLPRRITASYNGIHINIGNDKGIIKIQIFNQELKFFYDDYKEYYYYPELDLAYHKSVSDISASKKEKAKKCNCYSRINGYFIPQFDLNIKQGLKSDYSDKNTYIELSDDFLGNNDYIKKYATSIIKKIMRAK